MKNHWVKCLCRWCQRYDTCCDAVLLKNTVLFQLFEDLNFCIFFLWLISFVRFCQLHTRAEPYLKWCIVQNMTDIFSISSRLTFFNHKFDAHFTAGEPLCQAGSRVMVGLQGSCGMGGFHCVVRHSSGQENQNSREGRSQLTAVWHATTNSQAALLPFFTSKCGNLQSYSDTECRREVLVEEQINKIVSERVNWTQPVLKPSRSALIFF